MLHPGTGQPVGPDDLAPLFPMALILRRSRPSAEVEIPEEVRDVYRLWRPTPLFRAHRLEKALGTPARIYYKYEGVSPGRLAQAEHRGGAGLLQQARAGVKRLTTETGAGQWGTALAFAGALFGLECEVCMVRVSYDQKPYRRALMETFGARVVASPSEETQSGPRDPRASTRTRPAASASPSPRRSRSRRSARTPTTRSASVLNHVLMHQTVIGEEAIAQMDDGRRLPGPVIGCTGGGSNFAGLAFPFLGEKLARRTQRPRASPSSRRRARR